MTDTNGDDRDDPVKLREAGEFNQSGDRFTEEGYRQLSRGAISQGDYSAIGWGIKRLQQACLTYRIGNESKRAENRASQADLILHDLLESVYIGGPEHGILWEFRGDFHVLGGLEPKPEFYQKAGKSYRKNDMEIADGWPANIFINEVLAFYSHLIEVSEYDTQSSKVGYMHAFADRIEFKQSHYEDVVEAALNPSLWVKEGQDES